MKGTSQNSKIIKASPQALYTAFINPDALEIWLAPGNMVGKVHNFDLQIGAGYLMSLFYQKNALKYEGKTSEREDRFYARFVELRPFRKIVEAIEFDASNPQFLGKMTMEVTLAPVDSDFTKVIMRFKNIPPGIDPKDNEMGTAMSLEKLAKYLALR